MREGLFLDLQAPQEVPQIFTHLQQRARFAATEEIINMRGRGSHCAPTLTENEMRARNKRRYLELQTQTARRNLGAQQIPPQGLMKIRRLLQFPNTPALAASIRQCL